MNTKGLAASIIYTISLLICTSASANNDNYEVYKKAKSGLFYYHKNKDFSKYDSIFLFPTKYKEVKIAEDTKPKFKKSWEEFPEESWGELAAEMNEAAQKEFEDSKPFKLTSSPGETTMGLEFSFLEFTPTVENNEGDTGTVGGSMNLQGLGTMLFQIAVIDYKTQELLVMVKSQYDIKPSRVTSTDNKATRKLMWTRSFKTIVDYFSRDLESRG